MEKSDGVLVKSPYFDESNDQAKKIRLTKPEFISTVIYNAPMAQSLIGPRVGLQFFNVDCELLAKALLGCVLVRVFDQNTVIRGTIVETECYLGGEDKASFSYGGKVTERSKPMYMTPGTTFIYTTYGMYNLINISSRGDGAAVLIRALDPIEGIEEMTLNRQRFQPNRSKPKKIKSIPTHELCNGPAKLCISFGINKEEFNMQDLSTWDEMWIEKAETIPEEKIVKSRRIGIESAGSEWANKLLRYYILNNKSVSKRDKAQEANLLDSKC